MNSYSSSQTQFFESKIGLKQTATGNIIQPNLHKLSPLSIFRKDIIHSSKLKERFQVKGHKLLAKLSASGPETSRILRDVEKSHSIKFVKSFEFDPYLCDNSYIRDLRRICHKIKGTKRLNLVIRRIDNPDELGGLGPFIARFSRLELIRVEFPHTQNMDEGGLTELYKGISQCSFIKTLEWIQVNMPETSPRLAIVGLVCMSKLRLLENIKSHSILKKGVIRDEGSSSMKKRRLKSCGIRSIDVATSATGQWANMGMEKDQNVQTVKQALQIFPYLEKMRAKSIKTLVNFESFQIFFEIIPHFPNFHHLEWEFLNCQITDLEVIAFAQGLVKAQQIKYFSLKVIQNAMISEDCIEKVACALSRINHLPKFVLYFRKLSLHPRGIIELGKRIENSSANVHCDCSKESIYIYKRSIE